MKTSLLKALFSIKKENLPKVFIFAGIKIKIKDMSAIIEKAINKEGVKNVKTIQVDICKIADELTSIKETQKQDLTILSKQILDFETKIELINNKIKVIQSFNERFLFKDDFHIKYAKNFYKDIENIDISEKYLRLIHNLDENSITNVSKILSRIIKIGTNNQIAYDIFSQDEKLQIDKLVKNFYNNIFKLTDNCHAYQQYLLPINHFEPSVFYYKHQLDDLQNLNAFKDKDIVDVGGFIGDSALIFSSYTNRNVYSFEPVTHNYNLMLKTIELNKSKNIIPVNKALASSEEIQKISVDDSCSSINQSLARTQTFEEIRTTTLDKYVLENNLNIGLIKVDIEGYEQEFLKGAIQTIKKFRPTLLISIYHNASDFFDIKPLLESWNLNYSFKIVRPVDMGIQCETLLIAEQLEDFNNE